MRLVIRQSQAAEVVSRLSIHDTRRSEDARAAVEWLTSGDDGDSAVFTRRRLQLFLWYELPHKWLIESDEHIAVAEALATFFDELGPAAAPLSALCRDPETLRLLRDEGEGLVTAIEASGLEPPDTPSLEWSDLMTIEESLERDAVAEMLEEAVDTGQLVPGTRSWKERQVKLVEQHLTTSDARGTTPLARVLAVRRQAWLERFSDEGERALLEATTRNIDEVPAAVAAGRRSSLWCGYSAASAMA